MHTSRLGKVVGHFMQIREYFPESEQEIRAETLARILENRAADKRHAAEDAAEDAEALNDENGGDEDAR